MYVSLVRKRYGVFYFPTFYGIFRKGYTFHGHKLMGQLEMTVFKINLSILHAKLFKILIIFLFSKLSTAEGALDTMLPAMGCPVNPGPWTV